jgi:rSAM/selenodomain-associated transferase 2
MNAGAARASGSILLFLHADTRLPTCGTELVCKALCGSDRVWGRFDVRIESPNPVLWLVARMMNLRSCWSGIATGDQAIFVRRADFHRVGGFPNIPLMEDIALSKALRRLSKPACLTTPAITSARRWERHGVLRTVFLMWRLRFAYFCGADPADLARAYGYGRRDE